MPTYSGEIACTYGRVSTADQQNSMDMQDTRIVDYARFKKLTINPEFVFRDPNTSGTIPLSDRKDGKRLMETLESGKARHLILLKLDRLGRNALDIQQCWKTLTSKGVVIHVIDLGGDSFSSDNPMAKFIVGILALCAELEVERIRGRINDVFNHKFERGEQIGRVTFGWKSVSSGRPHPKNEGKDLMVIEPHPEEYPWAQKIINWRFTFKWSLQQIADELNNNGIKSKNGSTWSPATICNFFKSRHVKKLISELAEAAKGPDCAAGPEAAQDCDGERMPGVGCALPETASVDHNHVWEADLVYES